MSYSISNMRLGAEKAYYQNQLAAFASIMIDKFDDVQRVEFGKQDSRGALSITLFNSKHCVPQQRHFTSKDELLGFVVGYNHSHSKDNWL